MIFNMVGGGSFSATINVTNATASATVTATCGSFVYTATATASGTATIYVDQRGTYTLTCSGKYDTIVVVSVNGAVYTSRMLNVPSTYQEVEYIQSSGTQYIITSYNFKTSDDYEIKYSKATATQYEQLVLGGGLYSTATGEFYIGHASPLNNILYCQYTQSSSGNNIFSSTTWADTNAHIVKKNGDNTYLDGTLKSSTIPYTYECATPIGLFCLNRGGSIISLFTGNIYYYSVKRDGELIYNLIPCYRISDTEIGLYDTVNDVFYDNDGTGTFAKGGDVT